MIKYKSGITTECIMNHTICVKTKSGIRSMKFQEDIGENLVWVDNIIPNNMEVDSGIYLITKGTYVRYTDIYVSPRLDNFL